MVRPLRLEFAGALYHVTSRGDRREDIYLNDGDRFEWMDVLDLVCKRFNWVVHAYCEMSNHYHLLIETPDGNLSQGMRQLNGVYTQRFNRRHGLTGHLFQGRYKAILIQKEAHLLELSRYVVLNPVRARMVQAPEDWQWSSHLFLLQDQDVPSWMDADWLLSQFGTIRSKARRAYINFVLEGKGLPSPLLEVKHQLLLGDDQFIERHQQGNMHEKLREISIAHRRAIAPPLSQFRESCVDKNEAMVQAYCSGAYTMKEIGEYFGVHYVTVSRAVSEFDKRD